MTAGKGIKKEKTEQYFATGRRKEAIARVKLIRGSGRIVVNGRDYTEYFCGRKLLEFKILKPLLMTGTEKNYDVIADAYGGGNPGQAGAISLGIARALIQLNPDFRGGLKKAGFLARDPRMKERKKYGHKRARKSFQYSKR